MFLDGKITLLIDRDRTMIRIEDAKSGITFIEVILTPEQTISALSRMGNTPCQFELHQSQDIGKTYQWKELEFEIPDSWTHGHDKELEELANTIAEPGWKCDGYFQRHNTFFKRDKKWYARCNIQRWV